MHHGGVSQAGLGPQNGGFFTQKKWLKMAHFTQNWLKMAHFTQNWLKIGSKWQILAQNWLKNGRIWLKMAEMAHQA